MIDEIQVRNLALIREAHLSPSKGLTVITGETGAGKTALISACKLLCGERADSGAIREGTDELCVEGRILEGEEEIVVTRRVSEEGRSRITIDGSMASVKELQAKIGPSVDLCGQHEHQQLLKTQTHGALLDAWATDLIAPVLEKYQQRFDEAGEAATELERVQAAAQSSSAQLDEARFVLQRIDAVAPFEGEYDELIASLAKAEHAETLARATGTTHELLSRDGGAIEALTEAATLLEAQSFVDKQLGAYAENLREVVYVLEDVSRDARTYHETVEYDPQALEVQQERLSALQGLMRTYGPRMEDVLNKRAEAAELVSLIDESAERERRAKEVFDQAEEALAQEAQALDAIRNKCAPQFAQKVNEKLCDLEMVGASIVCSVFPLERAHWTKTGPSQIEFLFKAAEGMTPRPLARIASGGEVSRVMLAIKVVLGATDKVDTLVFDEVDAGVGGATARALAKVLVELAQSHQVLVVTHLPQIAVVGDTHYLVLKQTTETKGVPETEIVLIEEEERVKEIARMLSGEVSEASRRHAEELLGSTQ